MADVGRHPNIQVLANTDINEVTGEAGNFTVMVTRRPRYVDEELCRGCRTCASYCPYTLPNPFDENLSNAKAIDIWSPQSIPSVAVVDRKSCLYFQQKKCMICIPVCQSGAIDFSQKRRKGVIRVGAIIISSGYNIFDARSIGEYGYGRMINVVNSLEFERLLNADGPYHGEVLRLSDAKIPSRIAWLQCAGSRDMRLNRGYCSSVCCSYAIKQALLVKYSYPETEVTIFHNDIRTYGKGYEDLYNRAQSVEGFSFIRKRISKIKENVSNNNLIVNYVDTDHDIKEEEFGMVVLSVGIDAGQDNKLLAQVMDLELGEYGFCRSDPLSPSVIADRKGIFPASTFTSPMDIPDAISSACSAGAMAAQSLSSQRGTLTMTKIYPPEKATEKERLRIGVFVCHCGTNIAGIADTKALAEYAMTLSDVVHCEEQAISCAADSLKKITEVIKERQLNRVVVAACTPRDHEAVFREALREAGLNAYLLDMANIREHCTWVHSQNKEEATKKAEDIIAMSVARVRNLSPLQELELSVKKKGLVLGGGLAGMSAALSLARQGFEVYLVEKESRLGGNLIDLHYTLEGVEVQPFLSKLRSEVGSEKNIKVFLGYKLKAFAGYIGNFRSTLVHIRSSSSAINLEHGIIIIATGGKPLRPTEYRYGESKKIVTQQELEGMIAAKTLPTDLKQVAIIQCVEARNEKYPYCSRICCGQALKNALKLKEINEKLDISIFYRDMRAYGFREDYYRKAREKGISFHQYEPDTKPKVSTNGEGLSLHYHDSILAMLIESKPDLLVLSTPLIPEGNEELSQLLRIPLTRDGFFMEAHMKLRPLDLAVDGMFLCGAAHYPKYIPEIIVQANGAALRAATILSHDTITSSGSICNVNEDECIGCKLCVNACPYGAIELNGTLEGKKAQVIPAACKGCGVCDAVCPTSALSLNHFTDQQIFSQIEAAYSIPIEKSKPKILAILCHWCGYAGADLAGVSRIQYAANIRPIRVMCSGRIHPKFIYYSFLQKIDAVLVVGCHPADCHYISGINQTLKTIPVIQSKLENIGISPERVRLEMISAAEGAQFARIVDSYTNDMTQLGALELDTEQQEKLLELKAKQMEAKKGKTDCVADSTR